MDERCEGCNEEPGTQRPGRGSLGEALQYVQSGITDRVGHTVFAASPPEEKGGILW